jgi:hypothetical protein
MLKSAKALEGRRAVSRAASFSNLHGRTVIGLHEIAQVAQAIGNDVEDWSGIRKRRILRQTPHAQARLPPDASGFRNLLSADSLKKCGFAGAVATDDADAFALLYLKARVVQKWKMPEGDRYVIKRNQRHGNSNYAMASVDANSS